MQTMSIQGNYYFMTIVDNYTGRYYIHYIKTKDQAFKRFQVFHAQVETSLGYTLWNACFN
jgi:hypothetical protein